MTQILLIEDYDEVRRMAAKMLRAFGHDVIEAIDADTGKALFDQHKDTLDLSFTDMEYPGGGGPAVIKHMRS